MSRFALILALPVALAAQVVTIRLEPETERLFEDYRKAAESQMDWKARFGAAKPGDIQIAPVVKDGAIDIKSGMIHDWAAGTIVPGKSVEKVLALLQDYANYKNVYAPEIRESRVLGRDGNHWRVYFQIVKKKAFTVIIDGEYEIEYKALSEGRWAVISRATKLSEVEGGKALDPNHGFLWKLNSYWLIEPRREGVYLECRAMSLTRDIPNGLGWMLRPMVTKLPRESLNFTMEATARSIR